MHNALINELIQKLYNECVNSFNLTYDIHFLQVASSFNDQQVCTRSNHQK